MLDCVGTLRLFHHVGHFISSGWGLHPPGKVYKKGPLDDFTSDEIYPYPTERDAMNHQFAPVRNSAVTRSHSDHQFSHETCPNRQDRRGEENTVKTVPLWALAYADKLEKYSSKCERIVALFDGKTKSFSDHGVGIVNIPPRYRHRSND